ncbi:MULTISPECIES: DUF397 domain-containing protein [unclassified Streptomyces]|uniref:DUF397 domain-containing protein n=1 Tax=unclassified Streptomyces TaxID=2593676 RepID=UPI0023650B59|nr:MULTISPECIES: DUF397 domain-containing protein [unclassified Streptomyces]MDF3142950.1 DUF397 domain-containing protein [Streptomyces sp. T21Q-yed]WDF40008.1 DUF397 domain-containing protein [Streptomyces sp. T12]
MAQDTVWQKSSFSGGGDSSDCVELAARQGAVLLRESDDPGTVLEASRPQVTALIRHLRTA